jgi:tetratricopeptide (TPR) repeat protein
MKNYENALTSYQKASVLKAGEKYPLEKIAEINSILGEVRTKENAYAKAILEGDSAYSLNNLEPALSAYKNAAVIKPSEKYPKEKISLITGILNKQQAEQEKYDNLITLGDKAYAARNYSQALTHFKDATLIKSAETYPADRIAAIQKIMSDQKAQQEMYDQAIATGNRLLNEKQYERALAAFKEAQSLMPEEKYPNEKISEINLTIESIRKSADDYTRLVKEGDSLLAKDFLNPALMKFKAAQAIMPAESYPGEKIAEINSLMQENDRKNSEFDNAIAAADQKFQTGNYQEAIILYESSLKIKPGEKYPISQIQQCNDALADIRSKQEIYDRSTAEGDRQFQLKNYTEALAAFRKASEAKPSESYPELKIKEINALLDEQKSKDKSYADAIATGDTFYNEKKYREALEPYERAITHKPSEEYPKSQKEKILKAIEEQKRLDDQYNKFIADADSKRNGKEYSEALNLYQQASEVKPGESYPKDRISEINQTLLFEKEEQEKLYKSAISEGDQLLAGLNYIDAKRAYVKASGIKPEEKYPKDKIIEINLVLDQRAKALKDEYDKAIVDADRLYQQKILDQAIEAYEKAGSIKPDETYPVEMLRKIRQYIADHSILEVNSSTVIIPSGEERKFSFKGIEPRLRSNNYVMVRAKAIGTNIPKVYFSYGRDNAKNGGIVLRTMTDKEGIDYVIRLAGQDKWYREDNNWLSFYTEGADVEISKIQISQGD